MLEASFTGNSSCLFVGNEESKDTYIGVDASNPTVATKSDYKSAKALGIRRYGGLPGGKNTVKYGGFIVNFSSTPTSNFTAMINTLKQARYIDRQTRQLIYSFMVYSPGQDLW